MDANPNDVSVLMVYAEANLRKGNRLEAMKAYQKVIKVKPGETKVRLALTKIYFSLKHYHDAFEEIVNIFEIDPKDIEAHLFLMEMLREEKAPKEFRGVLDKHRDFKAPPSKVHILKTQLELEKRKFTRLIEDYDRQLEQDEGNPIVLYSKNKAEERLERAVRAISDLESIEGGLDLEEEVIRPVFERPKVEAAPHVEPDIFIAQEEEVISEPMPPMEEIPEEIPEQPPEETPEIIVERVVEEPVEEVMETHDSVEMEDLPEPEMISADSIFGGKEQELHEEAEVTDEPEEIHEPEARLDDKVEFKSDVPPLSPEKKKFFDGIKGEMEKSLKALNRTRGVSSSLIMDSENHILQIASKDSYNPEELGSLILEGVGPLLNWKTGKSDEIDQLLFWVMEFKNGLLVLQPLTTEIFLVVMGKRGANFGAVRYGIEKNTGKLLSSLANALA